MNNFTLTMEILVKSTLGSNQASIKHTGKTGQYILNKSSRLGHFPLPIQNLTKPKQAGFLSMALKFFTFKT